METKLDRIFEIQVNIENREVTIPKRIYWYITDENVAYIKCKLINEKTSIVDIENYQVKLNIVKPNNDVLMLNFTLVDEINNIFELSMPIEALILRGKHICELTIEYSGDILTSESFAYTIKTSILNLPDAQIIKDTHYPLVLQLESALNEANIILEEQINKVTELNSDMTSAENIRQTNEKGRISAEINRQANEEKRKSEETSRFQSETNRANEEAKRVSQENTRISQENTRISQENTRISQENTRVLAEQQRAEEYNNKIQILEDLELEVDEKIEEINNTKNDIINNVDIKIEEINNTKNDIINNVDIKMQEVDTAEQQREGNETERILAEQQREGNETERILAEQQREVEREEQNIKIEEGLKELHEHLEHYPACSGKKYGVRFYKNSSSPQGERLGDAIGLTASVGVGQEYVANDFDDIYPWGFRRICNLNNDGRVTAYEGDADFQRDGSNGHVMVETPLFYQKYVETDEYMEYWIADYYAPGFRLSPRFKQSDGTVLKKIYTGAYEASLVDGKLTSISGLFPKVEAGRHTFRNLAKLNGDGFGLTDIAYRCDILFYLFVIEFATLNSQSIMQGLTTFSWDYTTTEATVESNILTFSSNNIAVGFTLRVDGTDRRVVNVDSNNNTVTVDGEPFSVDADILISARAWICGETDNVKSSSGSMISNTDGKNCCKYRGEENPWGNIWEWVDGCNIKDHQAYVHWKPTEYTDDIFDSPYNQLGYINSTSNGYIKTIGYDENNPYAQLPTQIGASSSTYFSDYYYQSTGNRAPLVGAYLSNGSNAGLVSWRCNNGFATSDRSFGARLSYKPS